MADLSRRLLEEAEGYLLLQMPKKALEVLREREDWNTNPFEANFLAGQAFRQLEAHSEALKHLAKAFALRPDHLGTAFALATCYRVNHQLAEAIDVLKRVEKHHAQMPLVHYNMACYWSLAGNPDRALRSLRTALRLDPELVSILPDEADFDPIREDDRFHALVRKYQSRSEVES